MSHYNNIIFLIDAVVKLIINIPTGYMISNILEDSFEIVINEQKITFYLNNDNQIQLNELLKIYNEEINKNKIYNENKIRKISYSYFFPQFFLYNLIVYSVNGKLNFSDIQTAIILSYPHYIESDIKYNHNYDHEYEHFLLFLVIVGLKYLQYNL